MMKQQQPNDATNMQQGNNMTCSMYQYISSPHYDDKKVQAPDFVLVLLTEQVIP
jgi:hypothetical protein